MKNIIEVANNSAKGTEIYYSFKEGAVYTEAGEGRYFVTTLLRANTAEEIRYAVRRWMAM